MDELIARLVAKVGIDAATAEAAVGIILGFLRSDGPTTKVQAIIDQLLGAEAVIAAQASAGGGMGGFLGGGVMGVGSKLMAAGLGMGEIATVAREILGYARDRIGAKAVDDIVVSTPGLSQFV
ncbi:MAG: DUF2267 domain-containing protein [Xanthobacteraceae bacterium]|nr:MAG: DUF2267 domain-containing protein [Xanthobacteraceae bacterium]